MPARNILYIGVDFGVSTSGVSYYLLKPGGVSDLAPKATPLQLRDDEVELEPSELGIDGPWGSWGSGIPANEQKHKLSLLKLSLLHPEDLPKDHQHPQRLALINKILARIVDSDYTGIGAVAEYIKRLWADASTTLRARMSHQGLDLNEMDVRFVFGVPAVWHEDTIIRMNQAVVQSGVLSFVREPASVDYIPEPEAAAIAVIPGLSQTHPISVGHTIVICDCGGGTIDVISYEVTSLSPLAVCECVPGEGKLAGDMFMRSAFDSLVREQIANHMDVDGVAVDVAAFEAKIEQAWEQVRNNISGVLMDDTWTYCLEIPRLDGANALSVNLPGLEIVRAFRNITNGALDLTTAQTLAVMNKKGREANLIVVVGGFGCNKMLQLEMKRRFGAMVFFTGQPGQYAVKNGAALAGAQRAGGSALTNQVGQGQEYVPAPIKIQSRISRYSYGFWDGTGLAGHVTWFIKMGDDIPVGSGLAIDLPKTAFNVKDDVDGRPCVPIYRVRTAMSGTSVAQDIRGISNFCTIHCLIPQALTFLIRLQLRVHLKGRAVHFEVLIDGSPADNGLFAVKNCWRAGIRH